MPTVTHCLPRVTPGLSAAFARAAPAKLLINVDFPTLGMPTTITRIFAPAMPLTARRSRSSANSVSIAFFTPCTPPRFLLVTARQPSPPRRKYATQRAVTSGSARSALFSTYRWGLPAVMRAISGFRLLRGMRASKSWSTASTLRISFSIRRSVFVICPGNHWMGRALRLSFMRFSQSCSAGTPAAAPFPKYPARR